MTGPFDNKGRGVGGVFPNLSDRLDTSGVARSIECACHPKTDADDPGPIEIIERRESDGNIR